MQADHRRLGRELDVFDSDPLIGAGLPFWLPPGAAARHEVESYVRDLERRAGFQHVHSPVLAKRELYELSGHWAHFAGDMFPPVRLGDDELVLRPSLCPHHALIFRSRHRSYRELPLRIAEIGPMYRAERSGVLGGLSRVRAISLNDGHVFCTVPQAGEEVAAALRLMGQAHDALGVRVRSYRLSLRGDGGEYAGDDDAWDEAGRVLREALEAAGVPYEEAAGEAAFYGPKIDVQVADPAGRESTLSTVQLDFHQPAQFGLSYADASGGRARPVMVHRSLVGSFERLFAHLVEVHAGALPPWYAPVQVVVLPVAAAQDAAAAAFARDAVAAGLRAEVCHDGSVGARIRAAAGRKVPYVAVIGAREAPRGEVALRLRDGRRLPARSGADAISLMARVVAARAPGV
ncbi:threonine--tRNA ligase [Couchioplanes caeruleus]|uniref:Threonine--tRNA ligase n=2 Tax=Couchioplanes caeruleus TaxID=56438 RepID=A0A1K0GSV8_9ACTN|nr:threonine--tRNA ligase [Couchioplanes caeruleus]OJF14300.1 threonine--tRNA ligase [Couchioplanes caeruleus subsp. caeruleus]ROP27728.1 threonyl-tRNA synthetase [Couchioplanes caeruleus]